MRRTVLLLVLLSLALMSGCVMVHAKTTAFSAPDFNTNSTIFVVAYEKEVNNSLEFAAYKAKFEACLSKVGFTVVKAQEEAQLTAIVSYGIDTGKTVTTSEPIFGQVGGGTSYTSGNAGGTFYSGTTYSMPTYGVVGVAQSSGQVYTRAIALDIVKTASLKSGKLDKVYEARLKSAGSCSVFAGVVDELLEAFFRGFPGDNGKVRSVEVPSKGGC